MCVNVACPFSPSWSSAAASVTDCAVFQFPVVNVRLLSELLVLAVRLASPPACRDTVTVTLPVGCVARNSV